MLAPNYNSEDMFPGFTGCRVALPIRGVDSDHYGFDETCFLFLPRN